MSELIQRTDDLNTGREKLNNAIKHADKAKTDSEEALQTANLSLSMSENTQNQLNQVVIEGDSSVEAAQARVDADNNTFTTLKDRLDTKETQFTTRLDDIAFNVKDFGLVGDGTTDNTIAFNNMITQLPEGSRLIFPKGVYKGNFISSKSFDVDFQFSTLIPTDDNLPLFQFVGDYSYPEKNVSGNPEHGMSSLIVDNVNDLEVDDIVYIYDESVRPSDNTPGINTELLKIKDINNASKTITFYDFIRSNQKTGTVKLKKVGTIKEPKLYNLKIENTNTNTMPSVYFRGCENAYAENVDTQNTHGHAVRFENCYGWRAERINVIKPRSVGSGEGYGVTSVKSRNGIAYDIYGLQTRHVIDFSSSYNCYAEKIIEDDALQTPVVLSHNGYGGNNHAKDIFVTSDSYAVVWHNQGIQNFDNHFIDSLSISNLKHIVPNMSVNDFISSIYILLDYRNIEINNIETIYLTSDPLSEPQSRTVRLRGNPLGNVSIKNIYADKIGSAVFAENRNNQYINNLNNFTIQNVAARETHTLISLRGIYKARIDTFSVKTQPLEYLINLQERNGITPNFIDIEGSIETRLINIINAPKTPTGGFKGSFKNLVEGSSAGLVLDQMGSTVTQDKILNSSGYLQVSAPIGQDATLNSNTPFDPPLFIGQELNIAINGIGYTGNRGNVIIPAGSDTYADSGQDITLEKGNIYKFIGYNGKWRIVS